MDVFDYVGGDDTCPLIVERAGSGADDDSKRLSLVEWLILTFAR